MEVTNDPYEQQLFNVFSSHNPDSSGSLGREGLTRLCETLQLEDRGRQLLQYLLEDSNNSIKVTFREFKEGLLHILAVSDIKSSDSDAPSLDRLESGDESDREVSPKLVLGSKKYGRRSRPQSIKQDTKKTVGELKANALRTLKTSFIGVQRSASQSEVHDTNSRGIKLKRCASLPGYKSLNKDRSAGIILDQTISEEEIKCLQETWERLGVGSDGYMDCTQLEQVCECIGLPPSSIDIVTQHFDDLDSDKDGKISFDEFLLLFRHGADSNPKTEGIQSKNSDVQIHNTCLMEEQDCSTPATPSWPNDSGMVSIDVIADMWLAAGVTKPSILLQDLGFEGPDVRVGDLATILDDELRELQEISSIPKSPLTPLLQGSLALHRAELGALRQALRQLAAESRKLRAESREANQRASLLAQEVDERHVSLETSTRNQLRQLEQRHSEVIRDLMAQIATEREQWSTTGSHQENRLAYLENEETRLRAELDNLRGENISLEGEQRALQEKIVELEEAKICLLKEVKLMQGEKEQSCDIQGRKDMEEMLELLDKISSLQFENTELRDRNDELCAEVENITSELTSLKIKKSITPPELAGIKSDVSFCESDVSGTDQSPSSAMKRRGDSPSKTRVSEESPRLGKLRKCHNKSDLEDSDGKPWLPLDTELAKSEALQVHALSEKNDRPIDLAEMARLKARVIHLESLMPDSKVQEIDKNILIHASKEESNSELTILKKEHSNCTSEKQQLQNRCNELEASLELLRTEYERCEDYWATKLDEERQIFEQEQQINDEKFSELLKKMTEYEDQFGNNTGRLSPIEERGQLEQQFMDLETEYEKYRNRVQSELELKENEIVLLKEQINILEQSKVADCGLEDCISSAQNTHLDSFVLDVPKENDSPASSPISYLWNQSTIISPARDYQNPNFVWTQEETATIPVLNSNDPWQRNNVQPNPIQKPSTFSSYAEVTSECPKFTSELIECDEIKLKASQLEREVQDLIRRKEVLSVEIERLQQTKAALEQSFMSLQQRNYTSGSNSRMCQLDQRCRHLQSILRQQQQYSESVLHQSWQQYRSEIVDLRSRLEVQCHLVADQSKRLARSDMLCKELYVENSQLSATVQRLEQRCRMFGAAPQNTL